MSMPPRTEYDAVPYPAMIHANTWPGTLFTRSFLLGLDPTPPDRARVLELGCGDGLNLCAMAERYPQGSYLGIDLSSEAITRGRRRIERIGSRSVRLEVGDITALPDLGQFDYVISHGVYSWVPAPVRDALLASVRRHLAPGGIGYVSYLVLPGAYMREAVRTILRFHTRDFHEPAHRTRQARSIIAMLAAATDETNAYTEWLKAENAVIQSHDDESLFHDELSDVSHPVLLATFAEHAAAHGLVFIGESEYNLPVAPLLTRAAQQALDAVRHDRLLLEQYIDFAEGRRFRQSLLAPAPVEPRVSPERIDSLHATLVARPPDDARITPGEILEFKGPKKGRVRTTDPAEQALLLTLAAADGAQRVDALLEATRQTLAAALPSLAFPADHLRRFLLQSALPGILTLTWDPPVSFADLPARPRASAVARALLAEGFERVPRLDGSPVPIEGRLGRHLLSLLDGSRDHAALLAAIQSFLSEAAANPSGDRLPSPDDPALGEQLKNSILGLVRRGLLHAT